MSRKILCVDDERAVLTLLEESFMDKGYEVLLASSGEQALAVLDHTVVSVVLTDINMSGISGVELCQKIREFDQISVVIGMTGYSSFFELTNCREAGFDDYIKKPFDFSELFKVVESSFDKLERWQELFKNEI